MVSTFRGPGPGVWMKDPPKQWRIKHEKAQKRFATISPDKLLH